MKKIARSANFERNSVQKIITVDKTQQAKTKTEHKQT